MSHQPLQAGQGCASVTLPVALVESLPRDPPLVEDEHAGIGLVHVTGTGLDVVDGMILLPSLVDEAEPPDDVTPLIRQQGEDNRVLLSEGRRAATGS